jgi:hypothetical protein
VAKTTTIKFNKSVDTGPLPEDADVATRQTIQDERIRRQKNAALYIRAKKQKRAKIAASRAGY